MIFKIKIKRIRVASWIKIFYIVGDVREIHSLKKKKSIQDT